MHSMCRYTVSKMQLIMKVDGARRPGLRRRRVPVSWHRHWRVSTRTSLLVKNGCPTILTTSTAYNSISRIREYGVASMLMLILEDLNHDDHTLSDRKYCRAIVPKYHGDLSTACNYTCLLVAFRDAVVSKSLARRLSSCRIFVSVCRPS